MNDRINGVDIQIGAAVSMARRRLGWSQAELAQKLGSGWHQQKILRVEKAEQPLKVAELLRMAEVMHVPAGQLCGQLKSDADSTAYVMRIGRLEKALSEISRTLESAKQEQVWTP